MKIALVHDYLVQAGGAERVVVSLHKMFPEAPIFTSIADPALVRAMLPDADVRTSWMQRLPGKRRHYRKFFMFYPGAMESLDLQAYDLVISNSSAYAKSVVTRPDACHVCYCHSPMRFAWDFAGYAAREGWSDLMHRALKPLMRRLRRWDLATAQRPTTYLANSTEGAKRIDRCYGITAGVVFPPVAVERFSPGTSVDDYYLVLSRLVAYKRIDLAIDAFNRMGRKLLIIGEGPARAMLERMAGPTVHFLGRLPDGEVAEHLRNCRALIFPGEEDFGLTPLETNASGRPVVAYRAGGALDTVREGLNGVFFDEQTPEALANAVEVCEITDWDVQRIRTHAEGFREEVFRDRMLEAIKSAVEQKVPASAHDSHNQGMVAHLQHH